MEGTPTVAVLTVMISGEIDIDTCDAMRDAIRAGRRCGRAHLAVDLSGVTFMDVSGIRVLLAARGQAAAAGGSLTLLAPSPAVRRLISILGLQDVLLAWPAGR
jgi:anti-anti-sigma factor